MGKVTLATDPVALAKTEVEIADGRVVIRNSQDAEPIVERNKRWQSDGQGVGRNFRHAARIPLVVYFDLMKRGLLKPGNEKKLKAWLNDPDNRAFRVWPGRV